MQLVASWQTNVVFLGHLRSVYPAVLNLTTYSTTNLHGQKVLSYVIGSFTLAMEPQDSNI